MLKIKRLRATAHVPHNATPGSAGYDLCAALKAPVEIAPGATEIISTGLAMQFEPGSAGFLFARSGLGILHGIAPANCVGVIDSDYRGEILIGLHNHSREAFRINPGDRIAQLVIMPVLLPEIELCDELDETERGQGGLGSTGA